MAEIGLDPGEQVAAVEDPVAAATELGRADVDRRHFLAAAAFTVAGVAMPLAYEHESVSRALRARTGLGFVGTRTSTSYAISPRRSAQPTSGWAEATG